MLIALIYAVICVDIGCCRHVASDAGACNVFVVVQQNRSGNVLWTLRIMLKLRPHAKGERCVSGTFRSHAISWNSNFENLRAAHFVVCKILPNMLLLNACLPTCERLIPFYTHFRFAAKFLRKRICRAPYSLTQAHTGVYVSGAVRKTWADFTSFLQARCALYPVDAGYTTQYRWVDKQVRNCHYKMSWAITVTHSQCAPLKLTLGLRELRRL